MPIRVYRCSEGHDVEEIVSGRAPPKIWCGRHRRWAQRHWPGEAPAAPVRGAGRQNGVAERDLRGRRIREVRSGKHRGLAAE